MTLDISRSAESAVMSRGSKRIRALQLGGIAPSDEIPIRNGPFARVFGRRAAPPRPRTWRPAPVPGTRKPTDPRQNPPTEPLDLSGAC
ncbi:hypothetical protein BJA5080_04556 [Bradyrhizobium diazoefficiens SEMIA 5080]|uniref:Uncharacterized protein n=1 Tax=Bradyrhizobium diazoefficiens SEMIA 5080 TaxID=754504 RepID=A0A837CKJ0_9BRAD|nr:hypothetical protein BJA5080_04556 [Bradyrhizobium diazoefficiens SEMIA 5080]